MTEFLNDELEKVKEKYRLIPGVELVACVPEAVHAVISKTDFKKIRICLQFTSNYPNESVVVELKSKKLSPKLLEGLIKMIDAETKKYIGQTQILPVFRFVRQFLEDTPLCICSDEISQIKRSYLSEFDEIKLKQRTSQIVLKLKEKDYFITCLITVPELYPQEQLGIQITSHNFPSSLKLYFESQAMEISRQCVTPPMKKKPKDPPFHPKPSLDPVTEFLVCKVMHNYPAQMCALCNQRALPENPSNIVDDGTNKLFVERCFCNHLYHHGCLNKYMKTPPFAGGKPCLVCNERIYHEKWKATPELREARWAHKEARRRELEEVVDFLE